jgi:hypothetical protein
MGRGALSQFEDLGLTLHWRYANHPLDSIGHAVVVLCKPEHSIARFLVGHALSGDPNTFGPLAANYSVIGGHHTDGHTLPMPKRTQGYVEPDPFGSIGRNTRALLRI